MAKNNVPKFGLGVFRFGGVVLCACVWALVVRLSAEWCRSFPSECALPLKWLGGLWDPFRCSLPSTLSLVLLLLQMVQNAISGVVCFLSGRCRRVSGVLVLVKGTLGACSLGGRVWFDHLGRPGHPLVHQKWSFQGQISELNF